MGRATSRVGCTLTPTSTPRTSPSSVLPTTIGRPVGGSSWLRRSLMWCLKTLASTENSGDGWMR